MIEISHEKTRTNRREKAQHTLINAKNRLTIMSDNEEEPPVCDWCDKDSKRRSLVMGEDRGFGFKWGSGDLVCASCLKEAKPRLFEVKYSKRRMFCTDEYFEKYWKTDDKAEVVKTPADHQKDVSSKTKRTTAKDSTASTGSKRQKATAAADES